MKLFVPNCMTSLFECCLESSDFAEVTVNGETYSVGDFGHQDDFFVLQNESVAFLVSKTDDLDPTEGIFEEVEVVISDGEGNTDIANAKIEFFICQNYLNVRHAQ